MMNSILLRFSFLLALSPSAFAHTALIYDGPGACSTADGDAGNSGYSCAKAAAVIAVRAGLTPKFVEPNEIDESSSAAKVKLLFKDARVWIQPGGNGLAYYQMSQKLRDEMKKFIKGGGGYVGWCAGAFMAAGSDSNDTAAIFPGTAEFHPAKTVFPGQDYTFEKVKWRGKYRSIYFEGGPYFTGIENNPKVEKIAYYDDGEIAAARTTYGKGRVFLSGPHPEAPAIWSEEDGNHDPDGLDHDLATEMVEWAMAKKLVLLK
jgi:glutamine amidotransferase PdxT